MNRPWEDEMILRSNFITRRYNEDIIWQICSSRNKGLFLFILIKQNIQGEAEIKEFRASRHAFRPLFQHVCWLCDPERVLNLSEPIPLPVKGGQ